MKPIHERAKELLSLEGLSELSRSRLTTVARQAITGPAAEALIDDLLKLEAPVEDLDPERETKDKVASALEKPRKFVAKKPIVTK